MKNQFTADTLEDAYKEASLALECSIIDLDIEVLQYPSKGFLGMFSKKAIIEARFKNEKKQADNQESKKESATTKKSPLSLEIEEKMGYLLQTSCFDAYVDEVKVDEDTHQVYIKIDGEDAALMIGKEGYRYKALSYMIYNWIKIKYNLTATLEIASFLQTQKESIANYIESLKERIEENAKVQTKPLDGILVKLALDGLREKYPEKYVAIRTLKSGKKIVIVNDYKRGG